MPLLPSPSSKTQIWHATCICSPPLHSLKFSLTPYFSPTPSWPLSLTIPMSSWAVVRMEQCSQSTSEKLQKTETGGLNFPFPFSILKFEGDIINFIRNLRLLWFGNVTYLLYTCMSCDSHVIYMYVHVHVAALGFFSSSWLTNVDGMKDLCCSSTVRLLSTQIWMERSMVL